MCQPATYDYIPQKRVIYGQPAAGSRQPGLLPARQSA